jgi:hypothetical protein
MKVPILLQSIAVLRHEHYDTEIQRSCIYITKFPDEFIGTDETLVKIMPSRAPV